MWGYFALQKILTFFQQKLQCICNMNILNFNDTLTNDVVNSNNWPLEFKP